MATQRSRPAAGWLFAAGMLASGPIAGCPAALGGRPTAAPCPSDVRSVKATGPNDASPGSGGGTGCPPVTSPQLGTAVDKSAEGPARDSFQPMAPLNRPRYGFAHAAFGGRIYVFGGGTPRSSDGRQPTLLDSIEVYDTISDTWAEIGKLPAPRFGAAAAVQGTRILVVGGVVDASGGMAATNSVLAFDPGSRAVATASSLPYAAWGIGLTALEDGTLLAAGGVSGAPLFMGDINTNPLTVVDNWTRLPAGGGAWEAGGKLPEPRGLGQLARTNESATLVGGRPNPPSGQPAGPADGKLFRFIPALAMWRQLSTTVDPQSGGAVAQIAAGKFLVAGGLREPPPSTTPGSSDPGFNFGDGATYLATATLTGISKQPLPGFPGATLGGAANVNGKVYVFGGLSGPMNSPAAKADGYVLRTLPQAQPAN
ncbi:MAG: hypothetical protein FJZ01_11660 [Candidatus Sericytochromatia bacterium]|nr:hypothetical protein [Candidatus Tanganyikabacteria bacterium]